MRRLLLAEMRSDGRNWVGLIVVVAVVAALVNIALTYGWSVLIPNENNAQLPSDLVAQLQFGAGLLLVCTSLPAIFVLAAVTNTAVRQQQERYARWRLAGVLPSQIRRILHGQVLLASLIGALIGTILSLPLIQPSIAIMLQLARATDAELNANVQPPVVIFTVIVVALIGTLGCLRAGRLAANASAVSLLRGESTSPARMGWGRWIIAGVALLSLLSSLPALFLIPALASTDETLRDPAGPTQLMLQGGLLAVVAVAAASPLVVPLVLRLWTRIIPTRLSAQWFLARKGARQRISLTTAAVTPLFIGVSLYGLFLGTTRTYYAALVSTGVTNPLNLLDQIVILSPGVAIAAVGSIVIVFMTGHNREREAGLLRATGATRTDVQWVVFYEMLIYAITAVILGVVLSICIVLIQSAALGMLGYPFSPQFEGTWVLALMLIALLGTWLVSAIPLAQAQQRSIREALSPV